VTALDAALADLEALAAGSLAESELAAWRGPYPSYTARFDRLWPALAEAGFDPGAVLDYVSWQAGRAPETTDTVAAMSSADLRHFVVAMRRAERFCDGAWISLLRSGLLLAALRRARALGTP
jgi:hypothetical protein